MASGNILHSVLLSKDRRVENLIKKLEEVCEQVKQDKSITAMAKDEASSAYIPMRVREIIQEALGPNSWEQTCLASTLSQENSKLLKELDKAQALLSDSRKDCHDLGVKYISISEKVKCFDEQEAELEEFRVERDHLLREVDHLKKTLDDWEERHQLHLRAYQDGHERQEEEIKQLQNKLADYQVKCLEMEEKLEVEKAVAMKTKDYNLLVAELQTTVKKLEKELIEVSQRNMADEVYDDLDTTTFALQQRIVEMASSNQRLRDQLRESQETNQRLAEDVHELTYRWGESQSKLEEKERTWQQKMVTVTSKSLGDHQTSLSLSLQEVADVKDYISIATAAIKRELAMSQDECKLLSEQITTRVDAETGELRNANQILMLELQQRDQDLAKVTTDLEKLSVRHEALQMQSELVVSAYEQKLGSLDCSLKESKLACEEGACTIDNLESSKAELEYGKSNVEEELLVTKMDRTQLINDLDTLKSCISAITDTFALPENELSDPTHQHQQKFPIQPKMYGTAEDMKRLKDWAVSVVKCGLYCRDKTVEELKTKIITLEDDLNNHEKRMVELEDEAKAHSASSKMMKAELCTCTDRLQEVVRAKNELEKQLEKMKLVKLETEHELAQTTARLEILELEKDKMTSSNFCLQDSVSKMKYDLEKLKEEKQTQEAQLSTKQSNTKKLEMQLRSTEGEANNLRRRITELEVDRQRLEKEISQRSLSLASFQVEKNSIQTMLKAVRKSEASTVATLEELKDINRSLEANKRQLTKSIKEVTDKNIKLDQENSALENDMVENEDKLQQLKRKNTELTEEVSQLSKNLDRTETFLREVQSERDSFSIEAAARSEALGTMKHTLAEVQIQRGKLNNTIAKMAHEKGDFIREKVSSSAEIAKLKEIISVTEERSVSLASVNKRLEKSLEELKFRNVEVEKTVADLEKTIFSLQQEKHYILTEKDKTVREKDEGAACKLNLKNVELQNALMTTKTVESELKYAIQQVKVEAERKMSEIIASHKNEIKQQNEHYQERIMHLKGEIESISKASRVESSRLVKQKELAATQFEEEKAKLTKRLEKIQTMFEDKCSEAQGQYEQSNHLVAEQRYQLDTCSVNARRLESELSIAEQCIQNLQSKLDEVKCEATVQIDSLKSRLKDNSKANSQLESLHNDTLITITKLEGQRDSLQRERNETQKKFEAIMNEKAELQTNCIVFRQNLVSMDKELAKINETVGWLQVKLNEAEDARTLNESDASAAHITLTKVESLHAQLISDHAAIQDSFTNSEQQKTTFQLDLRTAQDRVVHLEKQKEGLMGDVAILENRLTFATKLGELQEKEITNFRQRVVNLERERNELSMNLTKVQETLRMQGKVDAATKSELQSQVSELISLRDSLKGEISSLKMVVETTRYQVSETDSKLTTTCGKASSLAFELKHATTELKDCRSKYMELVGVLSGTLGITLQQDNSSSLNAAHTSKTSASLRISQTESGIEDSLGLSLHSSFSSPRQETVQVSICISSDSVREAILDLQKNLILAEKLKSQALSSAANLEKNIDRLENEKSLLESRLHRLNSALTSLQENFDIVSRERNRAEAVASTNKRSTDALEKMKQQLQSEIFHLHQRVDTHGCANKEAECKVKKLTVAQAGSEMEIKQHQMQIIEMELQIKKQNETISKQRALITALQSSQDTTEAEILRLQQEVVSSQQTCRETENQLKSVRESVQHIDSSNRTSQEREYKLIEKIQELEDSLKSAQSQKVSLDRKIQDLRKEVGEKKKEHDVLDSKLRTLSHNQLERDMEKDKLQNRIIQLEGDISGHSTNHRELMTKIQSMEVQLKQKEHYNQDIESKMVTLVQEKEEVCSRIKQVEEDLQAAIKGKQIANDLCSSLEIEKDFLLHELSVIREENLRLRGELREANYQSQRLDVLMSTQKKQLDNSLITTSKRNVDLMKSLREERSSAAGRDKESKEKIDNLSLEVGQLHTSLKMRETQWDEREQNYKKVIDKLESKIQRLEHRQNESKLKKIEFKGKERSLQNLHSSFLHQPLAASSGKELDLPTSSPINATQPIGCTFCSPGHQRSGYRPMTEDRGMSPHYEIKYPITSTPTGSL